ncbi:MAG: GNAT family N-acetyltransferase [Gemmatimonadaceae bacterium]
MTRQLRKASPALGGLEYGLATPNDAVELAALHVAAAAALTREYGEGPWSSQTTERSERLSVRQSRVLVARVKGRIVGTLRLATKKPWAIDPSYFTPATAPLYLLGMAVLPDWQRCGVGRRLLEEAIAQARAWPRDAIRLDAYNADAGAGGFYARCGWQPRGSVVYRGTPLLYFEMLLPGPGEGPPE